MKKLNPIIKELLCNKAMGGINSECCKTLYTCSDMLFGPDFDRLWEVNARPYAYCKAGILKNFIDVTPYNATTCAPLADPFKHRKGECRPKNIPVEITQLFQPFC